MVRFSIFGIPVTVQPFFWVTMVLIGSNFGSSLRGTPGELLMIALFVLAGFISILIHEMGHALTAKSFGAPTEVVLQAFGGYATYPAGMMSRWQSFLITAAGPAAQLVLALIVHVIIHRLADRMNDNIYSFFDDLRLVSVFWALLNLIPVIPLDGGQLVNAVLGPKRLKITLWITIVVGTLLAVGLFLLFKSFLFPIFLGMYVWQAIQMLKQLR